MKVENHETSAPNGVGGMVRFQSPEQFHEKCDEIYSSTTIRRPNPRPRLEFKSGEPFVGSVGKIDFGNIKAMKIAGPVVRVDYEVQSHLNGMEYMIVQQLSGTSVFRYGEQCMFLRPGSWGLIRHPRRQHLVIDNLTNFGQNLLFPNEGFDLALAELASPGLYCSNANYAFPAILSDWVNSALVNSHRYTDDTHAISVAENTIYSGMSLLFKDGWVSPGGNQNCSVAFDVIVRCIKEHASNSELCLEKVAMSLGCSSRKVQRVLSENGTSYCSLLLQARIDFALNLIGSDDYEKRSITDISYACGFDSLSGFSAAFKKVVGLTPSGFMKISKSNHPREGLHNSGSIFHRRQHTGNKIY